MKYIYPQDQAKHVHKFGVDISVYGADGPSSFVYEETDKGHFEEFYNVKSTYAWFIVEGSGIFVIDGDKFEVGPKDLVVVPPNKKVYYFGKMKMILNVSPAFSSGDEVHVRDIDPSESPYSL